MHELDGARGKERTLEDTHHYVYFTRANSEETTLEDLFFAHPDSIDMLNTFPTVLVMDSTYKTNTY